MSSLAATAKRNPEKRPAKVEGGGRAAARLRHRRGVSRLTLGLCASVAGKVVLIALSLWPRHYVAAILLFASADVWMLTGILIPNAGWLFPIARRFRTQSREIWLTIDDGPETATTLRMLDQLDRHQAKATFFLIGEKALEAPALVAEILRRGHSVGNHTFRHPVATFWFAGANRTEAEFTRCQTVLENAAGGRVPYFRPPAGLRSFFIDRTLRRHHAIAVGWTARGREQVGARTNAALRRIERRIEPGAILLVHESGEYPEQRLALLSALLAKLDDLGYHCVIPSIDQLEPRLLSEGNRVSRGR